MAYRRPHRGRDQFEQSHPQYFGPGVTYKPDKPKLYREAIHALIRWGSLLPPAEQVIDAYRQHANFKARNQLNTAKWKYVERASVHWLACLTSF